MADERGKKENGFNQGFMSNVITEKKMHISHYNVIILGIQVSFLFML